MCSLFSVLQVLIVCSTGLAGIMLLNYQQDYTVWVLPLIIVCLFAFLVAHCFLSIYEMVVDVLFLCFAIDTKYNDGSPGREFYMDKVLMVRTSNALICFRGKNTSPNALQNVLCISFLLYATELFRIRPVVLMNELSLGEIREDGPLGMDGDHLNTPSWSKPMNSPEFTLFQTPASLSAIRWIRIDFLNLSVRP